MTRRWAKALSFTLLAASAVALAGVQPPQATAQEAKTAVFAGGCFWCVEEAFEKVEGVIDATSGYTGGRTANPTYEQVSAGRTGHAEAVRVRYDPAKVTYETLLDVFWHNVDPFDAGGQFCDRGDSYRSAIFTADEDQKRLAEASKEEIAGILKRPVKIATEIVPLTAFYPAEGYHQNYYAENSVRYRFYKWNCGRAQRLEQIWGPPKS